MNEVDRRHGVPTPIWCWTCDKHFDTEHDYWKHPCAQARMHDDLHEERG